MTSAQVTAKGNSARHLAGVSVKIHNGTEYVSNIIAENSTVLLSTAVWATFATNAKNCTWATLRTTYLAM